MNDHLCLIYAYGFMQHHMIGITVCLYRFTVIIQFTVYIRKLLYKPVYTPVTYNLH